MNNYIMVNNRKIELTDEQIKRISEAYNDRARFIQLGDIPAGSLARIGDHVFLVLEQRRNDTVLIRRDILGEDITFGENNHYDGSNPQAVCNEFAEELAELVGEDNIVPHSLDLTSNDGLKDYGQVICRVSLLTAELYRKYVCILEKFKPERWWWLATPYSTAAHENDRWTLCVSPSGFIGLGFYDFHVSGVRPFCILNSSIFVSSEE